MKKSCDIRIRGIVQGVGFRPFVYRLANRFRIAGSVLNDTGGVLIHTEGEGGDVDSFIAALDAERPPLSRIDGITVTESRITGSTGFSIEKSGSGPGKSTFLPPDFALCGACRDELFSRNDRRYGYPLIACTECGPRFSMTTNIPYDRENTAMKAFPLCEACGREYRDPENRRFHAEPMACHDCGPHITLTDREGNSIIEHDSFAIAGETLRLLSQGKIVAIKGTGGYHLAVDAQSDEAVLQLRNLKGRPFKPFAVMAGGMDRVRSLLRVSQREEELLISRERPIVLLKIEREGLSRHVAPGLSFIGVMLPSTPFQHQLFAQDPGALLVMTSGNVSEEPIAYNDEDALTRLGPIADYFVSYNREIVAHCDDSVLFVENEAPYFIRRSRGYVPAPLRSVREGADLLAMGGDMKNSFALSRGDIVIVSQYMGDLATEAGFRLFRDVFNHYRRVYDFSPGTVVADMHPGYFTGAIARELESEGLRRVDVQHHHAHIASVMEEHGIDERVIGIAFDGTGYGTDGTLWGSEFLISTRGDFQRAGHFRNFPLPGGESAIHDVWKIGLSLLHQAFGREIPLMKVYADRGPIMDLIERGINSPMTCSIGRLFDGMAAILGISGTISSEAEAAILLEEAALKGRPAGATFPVPFQEKNGIMEIDTPSLVRNMGSLVGQGVPAPDIALIFHRSIAEITIEVARRLREIHSLNTVLLSGGVFQNRILLSLIMKGLEGKGFRVFTNRQVPCNDGCIALGQIAVAKERGR